MSRKRNSPPPASEAEVLAQCLEYLGLCNIPHWRANTGAMRVGKRLVRFGVKGQSDILGVVPPGGRLLAVEVKRKGGKPTVFQRAFLANVDRAGGLAGVVCSVEDLKALLRRGGVDCP